MVEKLGPMLISEEERAAVRPLQEKLLEILQYFDAFCRQYAIEYYIYAGTMLGAVRHQGFIPWDDDMDVILTQVNYEKFLRLFALYGDKKRFHLQVFGSSTHESLWGKLRANHTTFIEDNVKHKKIHQGIFMDLMTMQDAPQGKLAQCWQYMMAKFLVAQEYAFKNNPPKGIRWIDFGVWVLSKLPRFFCTRFAARQVKRFAGETTAYYSRFTDGGMGFQGGFLKRSMMGRPREYTFEGIQVMGPQHPEEFLQFIYGNWQEPPPIEIRTRHHCIFYDVHKDFREYLGFDELTDEQYL